MLNNVILLSKLTETLIDEFERDEKMKSGEIRRKLNSPTKISEKS